MTSRRVAAWAVSAIALGLLFLVGAALLLSWIARADAWFGVWIAIGVVLVAQVVLLARSPEGRDWLRRWWWAIAMQGVGFVIGVGGHVLR